MSTSFIEDLWSSIFTPGTTPTLLVATNATFAALQLVLFTLLLATYSVHFVALSILSGALWWSINWFAKEVREVQARQMEEEKQQQRKLAKEDNKNDASDENDNDNNHYDSNDDTETETGGVSKPRRRRANQQQAADKPGLTAASAIETQDSGDNNVLRKRESGGGGESSGYTSTDSEWEKVDKDKS